MSLGDFLNLLKYQNPGVWNLSEFDCGYDVGDPVDDREDLPLTITQHFNYPFEKEKYGLASDVLKIIFSVLVILIGVFGNVLVIVTILCTKHFRSHTNFYLCNLAVSDILVASICMWVHLGESVSDNWPFGSFMCVFVPFLRITSLTASVLFLLLIAGDRFAAIFFPLRHIKKKIPHQSPFVAMATVWVISIVVAIPNLLVRKMYQVRWKNHDEIWCTEDWPTYFAGYDPGNRKCLYSYPERCAYYLLLVSLMYILPILGMTMAYTAVIKKLWCRTIPGEAIEKHKMLQLNSKKKIIRMLITVVVVFVICWTPQQIMVFYSAVFPEGYNRLGQTTVYPVIYLAYLNSALNPLIYGGMNNNLRRRAFVILRKMCHCFTGINKVSPTDGTQQTYNLETSPVSPQALQDRRTSVRP